MFLESGDKHRSPYAYVSTAQSFANKTVIYFSGPYKLRWVQTPERHTESGNDQWHTREKLPFSSILII